MEEIKISEFVIVGKLLRKEFVWMENGNNI
jgi:hypothetical protein